ncbi:MAG: dehydrogenase [Planctomycetota bacterium]|nr:MAG: dehydrogenase [Planctomycetota bacterium]
MFATCRPIHRSIAASLLAVVASPCAAADWPQWRGPQRDGVWRESGVVETLPDRMTPDWEVPIGPGYNGPTVAHGRVFVMDRSTEQGQQERIVCLDSATGKELWKVVYDAPYTISYTAGPRASVTVDGNRALAVGAMGHFHCIDVETGDVLWKRDLNAEYDVDMPIWGIAASPLVYGDLVIQQVAGRGGACYVAMDKATGREVWRALDERAAYSSPIVVRQAGRDVLVCWTGESLSGLDPVTGKVWWSHPMPPSRMPIGIATPSVDRDLVLVSSFYDGSMMVRLSTDQPRSRLVWRARGKDEKNTGVHVVQTAEGQFEDPQHTYNVHAMIGTPIVQDGYVYAVDSYGELRCLSADNGRRVWEDLRAVPTERWATIHMVRHEDRVWMFNERGELLITRLSPVGLTILDRGQLIEPTRVQLNRRGGVCWSHPAFAERSVFARNDEKIIRVSLAADGQ